MSPVPGMESPALELALFLAFAVGLFVGAVFARRAGDRGDDV